MIMIKNLDAIHQGEDENKISLTVERRVLAKRRWRGQAEDGTNFGFDLMSLFEMECVFTETKETEII